MYLLSLMKLMKLINILLLAAFVFFLQFFLVDLLSLKMIRPDFLVIYIFYISLVFGKTPGVLIGFSLGLLSDLSGVGSLFGLAPLTYQLQHIYQDFCMENMNDFYPMFFIAHGFQSSPLIFFWFLTFDSKQYLFLTQLHSGCSGLCLFHTPCCSF